MIRGTIYFFFFHKKRRKRVVLNVYSHDFYISSIKIIEKAKEWVNIILTMSALTQVSRTPQQEYV